MIKFSKPTVVGEELSLMAEAITLDKLSGGNKFTKACERLIEEKTGTKKAFLTPSGTAALEMAALLTGLGEGDEVIMPSFTFSSTANAFVLRKATIVFTDVDPDTMNIRAEDIEAAITDKTKAVMIMHYAGVGCDMDAIKAITDKHKLILIEDAAQAIAADYNGKALGTFGDLACFSFHDTKNITSGGEGGAILINNEAMIERAEIIIEKGTNRSLFMKGMVDKYTWYDVGSSFLMSEIQAAYLNVQLIHLDEIIADRLAAWNKYYEGLLPLQEKGLLRLPKIPAGSKHNGHIFFIKTRTGEERDALLEYLRENGVQSTFHYIPLHSSPAGDKFGYMSGKDVHTTRESYSLLRLPLWYKIPSTDIETVTHAINRFFENAQ